MNLTQNFTLSEMTKSETALRFGKWQTTPVKAKLRTCACCVRTCFKKVRDYYGMGVKVNSGYRHPLVNSKVNGSTACLTIAKGSPQILRFPAFPNADLAQWIADNCEFRQLILEFYTVGVPDSGWVHVSFNAADNKKQVLTATKQNGKTVYLQGLVA
jgi:zinc D-Ala-D-Ala carboxypeptidase